MTRLAHIRSVRVAVIVGLMCLMALTGVVMTGPTAHAAPLPADQSGQVNMGRWHTGISIHYTSATTAQVSLHCWVDGLTYPNYAYVVRYMINCTVERNNGVVTWSSASYSQSQGSYGRGTGLWFTYNSPLHNKWEIYIQASSYICQEIPNGACQNLDIPPSYADLWLTT